MNKLLDINYRFTCFCHSFKNTADRWIIGESCFSPADFYKANTLNGFPVYNFTH